LKSWKLNFASRRNKKLKRVRPSCGTNSSAKTRQQPTRRLRRPRPTHAG
jgi:hypothetical protein